MYYLLVNIYCPNFSGEEIVFGVGNNLGLMNNFLSIFPNKVVDPEENVDHLLFIALQIILFTTLKVTKNQLHKDVRAVWCLPPAFGV